MPTAPPTTTPTTDPGRRAMRRPGTPATVALLSLPFLVALTQVVVDGPLTRIDEQVAQDVHSHQLRNPGGLPAVRAIAHLGSVPLLVAIVVVTAGLLWMHGPPRRRQAIFVVATTSVAAV